MNKPSYIELMEKKNKLLKELRECSTKGDKIILERQLQKVDAILKEMQETTVSGDIAVAPDPMNLKKDKKDKDSLLKRPKIEEMEESVNFSSFFDLDKNSDSFKR
jgi:hypothetical protein